MICHRRGINASWEEEKEGAAPRVCVCLCCVGLGGVRVLCCWLYIPPVLCNSTVKFFCLCFLLRGLVLTITLSYLLRAFVSDGAWGV
jgi:hypothetical protein